MSAPGGHIFTPRALLFVFAKAGEQYGDALEVKAGFRVFDPAVLHQSDQVVVDVGVCVDKRSVVRQRLTADLLQDLCIRTHTIQRFSRL